MAVQFSPCGYEASYDAAKGTCHVVVRGYESPDGKFVERGGPSHTDDKVLAEFDLKGIDGREYRRDPVRETFEDALIDCRDILGSPVFRNKPADVLERYHFAAAYDAAQKVKAKMTVLGVGKIVFSLNPSHFAIVDCFARDKAGAFWLMMCGNDSIGAYGQSLLLAAYALEAGGYVPSNASVRLGVWLATQSGPRFTEVPNDRAKARDIVIADLIKTPF